MRIVSPGLKQQVLNNFVLLQRFFSSPFAVFAGHARPFTSLRVCLYPLTRRLFSGLCGLGTQSKPRRLLRRSLSVRHRTR